MTEMMKRADAEVSCADRPTAAKVTISLLGWGAVAGPLYLVVGLAQAFTRDGFDITRHALSLLENGRLGWIQIVNFIATGLMAVAAAIGVRGALPRERGGTWPPRLIAAYGIGLICAGTFHADPADGFPPGTPPGQGSLTWHGMLHLASFGVDFLCLIAACFALARGLAMTGTRRLSGGSRLAGVIILVSVLASFAMSGGKGAVAMIYVAVVTGWAWLAVVSVHLARHTARRWPVRRKTTRGAAI